MVTVSGSGTLATDLPDTSTLVSNIALSTTTANIKAIQTGVNTLSGVISGTGAFNQNGTGRTVLTNAETYTGATNVNAGSLEIDGSLSKDSGQPGLPLPPGNPPAGGSLVTVNQGGTLGGSGTVSAITLKLGGTVEPGIGSLGAAGTTLHGTSMIWNGGATLTLQLGATSGDELAWTGALTKGTAGTFTLDLLNAGITSLTTYTLATFASTTFKATDFHLELPAGYAGMLVDTGNSLELEDLAKAPIESPAVSTPSLTAPDLAGSGHGDSPSINIVPTPEPGSATLLAFGGAALLGWRRRRSGAE
jgi:autotransporter-associated beta strand protein